MLTIAGLTIREALRKKIVLAGLAVTGLFLALYGTGVHFAFAAVTGANPRHTPGGIAGFQNFVDFQAALFLFMGLFVANLVGALVAVFATSGTIATEIEQGTLQPLVTRPISRRQILLGKWLGHSTMMSVYVGSLFSALVLIVYSRSGWMPGNVVLAGAVFVGQAIVILSAALFGSTLLQTATNAVIVLVLYMTALIGGIMEQVGVLIGKKALFNVGIVSGFIMPTDSLYRYTVHLLRPVPARISPYLPSGPAGVADMGPFGAASPPSVWMLAYAAIFVFVLVSSAVSVFSRRDL